MGQGVQRIVASQPFNSLRIVSNGIDASSRQARNEPQYYVYGQELDDRLIRPSIQGNPVMPRFLPGLKLSKLYYTQAVAPILERRFPHLRYSAGLLGTGSEILGYDTPQSTDHNWGLRLFIFLSDHDFEDKKHEIDNELRKELPLTFMGFPTSFGPPNDTGVRMQDFSAQRRGNINHYITFLTVGSFLGPLAHKKVSTATWLGLPQQRLLEITRGRIFHDGLGIKAKIRRFRYYPTDIWLSKLASQWQKISEEEAFVARASSVGDELGSRIIASRIIEELMMLCFLMEKRYAPYSKWFGRAFSELPIARKLTPIFTNVLKADSITEREQYLSEAYHIVAKKHNSLHITKPLPAAASKFWDRPYLVIHGGRFRAEIRKRIRSEEIRKLRLGETAQ
jgi:hypothetical protein